MNRTANSTRCLGASPFEALACEIVRAVHASYSRLESGDALATPVGKNPYGDTTLEIDRIAESEARRVIERSGISCVLISEESEETCLGYGRPEVIALLDPIDGSDNAARGMRLFGTSISFAPCGTGSPSCDEIAAAAVMNLGTGELFSAARGRGARLNGRRIAASSVTDVHEVLLALDANGAFAQVDRILPLLRAIKDVRRLGSSALELCYLAAGCVDAFVDFRGSNTILDLGAGLLIAAEAGATITEFDGRPINCAPRPVRSISLLAAGNVALHAELRRCLFSGATN